MKYLTKAVILILILFNAGVLISYADSPPPLPNTFSGTVKFENSSGQFDVPAGTEIKALIENVTKGSTSVNEAGKYSIDVSGTYDDDGKNIVFIANNLTARLGAVFNSSSTPMTLDLIINTSVKPVVNFPGLNDSPKDPDGDGKYEDINGNGRKDFNDVVVFFNNIEWVSDNQSIHNFDLNGNGRIDFNDIIKLFEEL